MIERTITITKNPYICNNNNETNTQYFVSRTYISVPRCTLPRAWKVGKTRLE